MNYTIDELKETFKKSPSIRNKTFQAMIDTSCPELKVIMEQNEINLEDVRYYFLHDLPLVKRVCPICGKVLHVKPNNEGLRQCCPAKECKNAYLKIKALNRSDDEKQNILNKRKKTNLLRYNVETPQSLDKYKEKAKQTNLAKYGTEYTFQSEAVKDKIKKTNLERYGVDNPAKNKDIYNKVKATNLEKYGFISSAMNEEVKKKAKVTLLEKYGTDNVMNVPEIRSKIAATNLERYGTICVFKNPDIKAKIDATNLERYGNTCTLQNKEIRDKANQTLCEKYGNEWQKVFNGMQSKTKLDKNYSEILELNKTEPVTFLEDREHFYGKNSLVYKYRWQCKECGEIFESAFVNTSQFPVCPKCHPKFTNFSKMEKFLVDFIKMIYKGEIMENTRSIIPPLELDIYIPELKLAIEFNGDYWHSEEAGTDKNYHLNKTKLCEEKGIHLIHIFEHDWLTKQVQILNRVQSLFLINTNRIFARKCIVREIDFKTASDFVNQHHLQGSCSSSYNIGLFFNNELISVMTFGKPRFNKKYEWELLRFCSSKPIIGGAGKLLKYFINHKSPTSLISYANRCWSSKLSNVYEKIGFKLVGESDPGYSWVKKSDIITRYKAQKHKLKDLLGEDKFDENLSESENMKKNGFMKVYDCGNLVYEMNFSPNNPLTTSELN